MATKREFCEQFEGEAYYWHFEMMLGVFDQRDALICATFLTAILRQGWSVAGSIKANVEYAIEHGMDQRLSLIY